MSDFTFRLRFTFPPTVALNISEPRLDLSGPHHASLMLVSAEDSPIQESKHLVLKGAGHPTEEDAVQSGERLRDALILVFAQLRIGADFGERRGAGGFFRPGLRMLEQMTGQRVLNDIQGLTAFESEPPPVFARAGEPTFIIGKPADRFKEAFLSAVQSSRALTDRERLAYTLFSASFFERSQDARFLFLIMAVEALAERKLRSPQVVRYVEELMEATKRSADISQADKDSLVGSLQGLRSESFRQAGVRLARERLPDRLYMDLPADKFFVECYGLRGRLVHADPLPDQHEVAGKVGALEAFVAALLTAPLVQ